MRQMAFLPPPLFEMAHLIHRYAVPLPPLGKAFNSRPSVSFALGINMFHAVGEDSILPPDCGFLFLFHAEGICRGLFSSYSSRNVFERGLSH